MVFFAEIAFIYGGNDSLEKDVFGSEKIIKSSERSSETTAISSGTGSGTHPHKILDTSGKDEHGDIHTTGNKRKTYILRFKFDFCEAVVKTRLEHS